MSIVKPGSDARSDVEIDAQTGVAPVFRALREAMANKSFETLDAAQRYADQFMGQVNVAPQADFDGLSAEQMHALLYFPFDCPQLVDLRLRVPADKVAEAPLMSLFLLLVQAIGDQGLKPTATGNLPRKICRDIALAYYGEARYAEQTRFSAINSELDFFDLHVARLVGELAGLVRRYKGKFIVSRKGRALLKAPKSDSLYPILFRCYAQVFNWAYRDGYPDIPFIQQSFLFTLYLLALHGNSWRRQNFYEDAYLRAFPMVLTQIPAGGMSDPEHIYRSLYTWRCLKNFAGFTGLADVESVKKESLAATEFRVRKRPLLGMLVGFPF
ncbi:MAG: hypothetical protein ABI228_00985 [Burkholderiaceae bacterium]